MRKINGTNKCEYMEKLMNNNCKYEISIKKNHVANNKKSETYPIYN